MILPLLTYHCTVDLTFTEWKLAKLKSVDNRAFQIINEDLNKPTYIPNSLSSIKRHAVLLARRCLDGSVCSNFRNYFKIMNSLQVTRNNGVLIELPKCNLEFGKKGFYFMAAKLYNALPLETRKEQNFNKFKRLLEIEI